MWTSQTRLQILPRTNQADYVQFVRATGAGAVCESSAIGMAGGTQSIQVLDGCTAGMMAHELGHAFGLQHEQVRTDRNSFVTVMYENVDKRRYLNFEQAPFLNRSIGYYDYGSIMHYGAKIFGVEDSDTIETVPVGIPIGQRTALSAGDIDGVSRVYGFTSGTTTITTVPAGQRLLVDGVAGISPQSFNWTPGSLHTVGFPPPGISIPEGPTPAFAFVRWTDGGAESHSITVSTDVTVFCAEFQERHQLAFGSASGGAITAAPQPDNRYYPLRLPVKLTATANAGSTFVAWNPAGDLALNGESQSTAVAITEVLNPNTVFDAVFSAAPVVTVDSRPAGRRVIVDGTAHITPARFVWNFGSTHTLDAQASQTSATGSSTYAFTAWQDGNTAAARSVTAGSASTTFTANYAPRYLLTLNTAGGGTVTATPPSADGFYAAGTVVQIAAQASAGSFFRYWLGDLNGGSPAATITINDQHEATAFFNTVSGILVTNAVSYRSNPFFNVTGAAVAANEIVSVFGDGIGPATAVAGEIDSSGRVTTNLGGVSVSFDGVLAPILYAASNQINVVVPPGVTPGVNRQVRVTKNGSAVGTLGVGVDATAPALATADGSGVGQAAALNQDNSLNSSASPAPPGSVITLFATGGGAWSDVIPAGEVIGTTLTQPVAPVQVRIGKLPAKVLYAGTAPGLVNGVLQVNVQLPLELLGGPLVPIQLIAGDIASPPGITIAVQ